MNQMSVWLMLANEGMATNETFCAATPSAMVFGKSDGDRFAVTRDLTLKPGYVLQFKVFLHQLPPRAGQGGRPFQIYKSGLPSFHVLLRKEFIRMHIWSF